MTTTPIAPQQFDLRTETSIMVDTFTSTTALVNDFERCTFNDEALRDWLDRKAAAVPYDQIIRELFENAIQSGIGLAALLVLITAVERYGVPKLAFVDTGIGMSPNALPRLVGQINSSKSGSTGRHGVGSAIVMMKNSPLGLEYITYDGHNLPCRMVLRDDGTGIVRERVSFVDFADLPKEIRDAGHGTMVVVHGHDENEDTFRSILDIVSGGTNKGYQKAINDRYVSLPANTTVKAKALRFNKGNPTLPSDTDPRSNIDGMGTVLAAVSELSGVYETDHWRVRYFVKRQGGPRKYDGDCATSSSCVAVALQDPEIPEVWENYVLLGKSTGMPKGGRDARNEGKRALAAFGLRTIADRVGIILEITDPEALEIGPNEERSVLMEKGGPFNLFPYAEEFRNNMPADLLDLVEGSLSVKNDSDDDVIANFFRLNVGLIGLTKVSAKKPTVSVSGARHGDQVKAAIDITPFGPPKPKAEPTFGPPKPKSKSLSANGGGGKSDVGQMSLPTTTTWDDAGDENRYNIADYDRNLHILAINEQCELIDAEMNYHLGEPKVKAELDAVLIVTEELFDGIRRTVRKHLVLAAVETVCNTLSRIEAQPGVWEDKLTPECITMGVANSAQRKQAVVRDIVTFIKKFK